MLISYGAVGETFPASRRTNGTRLRGDGRIAGRQEHRLGDVEVAVRTGRPFSTATDPSPPKLKYLFLNRVILPCFSGPLLELSAWFSLRGDGLEQIERA